jgi:hexosaminidase
MPSDLIEAASVQASAASAGPVLSLSDCPELSPGLAEITKSLPGRFCKNAESLRVQFRRTTTTPGEHQLRLTHDQNENVLIEFTRPCEAFRALGILMGRLESGVALTDHVESCAFDSLGIMLDVSRNGVLRPQTVEQLLRKFALMGINQVMLYTEDTYEVPGEPQFGYFRGGYTQAELKAIDDYATLFGIEVIPCIQTLGHLEQILQWPAYRHLRDTAGVILAGDAQADALVKKMITAASAPFRSKRIHIGMDEAHGIGSGQYRFRNGLRAPFGILTEHLQRTTDTCRDLGLTPMIWSDMFFRLGSKTNEYYDLDSVITPEVAAQVPADVQLVYWDYYHTDRAFYDDWIARHRAMGKEPLFAAGVWTWGRPWAALPHSIATLRAGMTSARDNHIREAFLTMWGDDGMECDLFSALPAIQFFAEQAYAPDEADANLDTHFRGSCSGTASAWIEAAALDCLPGSGDPSEVNANPAKWLLWHDPLLNFLEQHIPASAPAHYRALAARCAEVSGNKSADARLDFVAKLAAILAVKSSLHLSLRPAYRQSDVSAIRHFVEHVVPGLRREVRELWHLHQRRWHSLYRPFGWEVIERRYGGLLARLETLENKLARWLDDPASRIEELDCEPRLLWAEADLATLTLTHRQAATPSYIG